MPDARKTTRLYIAEEQQVLLEAYRSFFANSSASQSNDLRDANPVMEQAYQIVAPSRSGRKAAGPGPSGLGPEIEVVGSSNDTSGDSLVAAVLDLKPDVALLGFKILQPETVEKLEMVRESAPDLPMVMLSSYYDLKGIKALRAFFRRVSVGYAYLLKHTVDRSEQLVQVVNSVIAGRVIVDPAVMEGLATVGDAKATLLKELTPKELEVLGWMSKGYKNTAIAEVLGIDPKMVERYVNAIYTKLGTPPESKDLRVRAITLYLKATGQVPAEDFSDA